jgi:hypothetical protein
MRLLASDEVVIFSMAEDKEGCLRCKRARWAMTFFMLAVMAVILWLDLNSTV